MKRIALALLLLLVGLTAYGQTDEIYWQASPRMQWDAVTTDGDGNPLLPEDLAQYEVYISDGVANPSIETRPLAELTYHSTVSMPEVQLAFPYRTKWQIGVRFKHTDGGGNVTYSAMAYTSVPEDTLTGRPFWYVPLLIWFPAPTDLRDSQTPVP